jgi:hypothetical protein
MNEMPIVIKIKAILNEWMPFFSTKAVRSQIMGRTRAVKMNRGFFADKGSMLKQWCQGLVELNI